MTWNPRPDAGPPSACRLTIALGRNALAILARSSTHGPSALSLPRDRAVRTPNAFNAARSRSPVSQVKVCSG
ncbi:Uncharacterised protein [Mycobacterium tuberculosis]|uniref:Uncharacterized protein n=1 Tax=Mycobacterium tuberculosis TaxID=1773 RepID=A0A916PHH1_MYCTX|nr:Uncharacterised protein [Mycobacterium tuberculosis]